MHDEAARWRRRAAFIARKSAYRLQARLDEERDPDSRQKLSRRIVALQEIADTLDTSSRE